MKKPFAIKRPGASDVALQITSMADIFTIILVFLLKSFSTGAINVNPSAGLKLPQAKASGDQVEALRVEISERAVQVEDSVVVMLDAFQFPKGDVQSNGVSAALEQALKLRRKRQEMIANANSDVHADNRMLLVADERTPYGTLKSVMASAVVQGFADLKLVVLKPE